MAKKQLGKESVLFHLHVHISGNQGRNLEAGPEAEGLLFPGLLSLLYRSSQDHQRRAALSTVTLHINYQ